MDFKRCLTPHALLHTLTGVGLGLILVYLIPSLGSNALVLGVIVVVAGIGGEMVWKK